MRGLAASTLLLLALCALPRIAPAHDEYETYGKTDAEILALGQSGWYDFYTSQAGESTAGMTQAYAIYVDAARARNDALPGAAKGGELRGLLAEFGETAIGIASNMSGGGTIWIPMYASMAADAEDIVYAILGGQMPPAEPMMTGRVKRNLSRVELAIEDLRADPDATWFDARQASKDLRLLRTDFRELTTIAAGLDRAGSDRILQFCNSWAELAAEGMGE